MKKEDLWRLLELLQDCSLWEHVGEFWNKFYKLKNSNLYVKPYDLVRCYVGILTKIGPDDYIIDKNESINKWLLFDWWSVEAKVIRAVSKLQDYFIDVEEQQRSSSIISELRGYKVNKEHQ